MYSHFIDIYTSFILNLLKETNLYFLFDSVFCGKEIRVLVYFVYEVKHKYLF